MPLTTAIENKILDHFLGKTAWSLPAAGPYVGLSSSTPTKAGTNITEPSGGAYARVQITSAQWNAAGGGATDNNVEKTWAQATDDWLIGVPITYLVLWDHATNTAASNVIGFAQLLTPRAVLNGETAKILAGEFDIAFV